MLLSIRIAIITGGSRGIGRGIAVKFAEKGADIVVVDILPEEAAVTLEEISRVKSRGVFIHCDFSNSRHTNCKKEVYPWLQHMMISSVL